MKKHLALLLTILSILAILVACTVDRSDPQDPATAAPTDTETDPLTATPTSPDTDPATDPATETDTEPETVTLDGIQLDHKRVVSLLSNKQAVRISYEEDPDYGHVVKITSTDASIDPCVCFDLENYCRLYGVEPFSADDYRYVILPIRAESCSQSTFELVFNTGERTTYDLQYCLQAVYDNTYDGWQYVVFDMNLARDWTGVITGLRFDYQAVSTGAGEVMYIAGVYFAKDEAEMRAATGWREAENPFIPETDPAVESKVEHLLATSDRAPAVSNDKQTAPAEDASLDLWFNHAYDKTPAEDITSTGWNTYTLRLAKNEAEGVHLLLASQSGHSGLSVAVTPFTNSDGATLLTELHYGYYFDDVDGLTVADPIPLVKEGQTFDLAAGRSYLYLIKATSAIDSPAGQYTATVTVRDAEGNVIKTATVYAYVWNFVLPEETSLKTQMDLSWWNIYVTHQCWEGDDSQLYKNYYDLLLSNRVCAYTLPYATKGTYEDPRVNEYLDNPRVVAFNPLDWKTYDFDRASYNTELMRISYAYLSQKPEWLEKAYFYIVDEPGNQTMLDRINTAGAQLKENFPGYKMLSPMYISYALDVDCNEDYISYIEDVINVWCYKPYFNNTFAEYSYDRTLTYRTSVAAEKKFGTITERMHAAQEEGDEVWWYTTRRPETPEITLLIDTESVRHRILFWQQKLYNVDGFLYYLVNDWEDLSGHHGLDKKHETNGGVEPFDCYGNGVLLYCGADFDVYGPVSSLRLENVRDGIEDYEYLAMLESFYDEEVTDALIHRLATSVSTYNTDIDNFTDLRVALGNIIEQTIEKQGSN